MRLFRMVTPPAATVRQPSISLPSITAPAVLIVNGPVVPGEGDVIWYAGVRGVWECGRRRRARGRWRVCGRRLDDHRSSCCRWPHLEGPPSPPPPPVTGSLPRQATSQIRCDDLVSAVEFNVDPPPMIAGRSIWTVSLAGTAVLRAQHAFNGRADQLRATPQGVRTETAAPRASCPRRFHSIRRWSGSLSRAQRCPPLGSRWC